MEIHGTLEGQIGIGSVVARFIKIRVKNCIKSKNEDRSLGVADFVNHLELLICPSPVGARSVDLVIYVLVFSLLAQVNSLQGLPWRRQRYHHRPLFPAPVLFLEEPALTPFYLPGFEEGFDGGGASSPRKVEKEGVTLTEVHLLDCVSLLKLFLLDGCIPVRGVLGGGLSVVVVVVVGVGVAILLFQLLPPSLLRPFAVHFCHALVSISLSLVSRVRHGGFGVGFGGYVRSPGGDGWIGPWCGFVGVVVSCVGIRPLASPDDSVLLSVEVEGVGESKSVHIVHPPVLIVVFLCSLGVIFWILTDLSPAACSR